MSNKHPANIPTAVREGFAITAELHPQVSARSRFDDTVWDFYDEVADQSLAPVFKRINWDWRLPNGDSFLSPRYTLMLLSLKQLTARLLQGTHSYRLKPTKMVGVARAWQVFVSFLVTRPVPVYRFGDALPSDVSAFFESLKSRLGKGRKMGLSTATTAGYYSHLNYLYDLREGLPDGLTFRPSGEKSGVAAAAHTHAKAIKTGFIPDEDAKTLLNEGVSYIDTYAPILFDCWRKLAEFKSSERFRAWSLTRRMVQARRWLTEYRPGEPLAKGTPFDSGFEGIHAYERELVRLRTACFTLIGFSTGMRISEIASIKAGCVSSEERRNHGRFHWITAVSYKTEKSGSGVVRKWMCGELAARAVRTLEEMSSTLGASKETPYLFTTLDQVVGARGYNRRRFKAVTKSPLSRCLADFCSDLGLKVHVHPHMFRRTFARNIVRVDSTALLALKEHLKHWSLYMTDWYVGLDPDLISEYEAERQILSMELLEKICVSNVSGAGGRRWTVELRKRIEEGRLPRNFRGKAGSEFRKKLIEDIHDAGSVVTPCGGFTYCVFNKDLALCTQGHKPVVSKCNPVDCRNSYITEDHVSFHRSRLGEAEAIYLSLSEAERRSPLGEAYRREISKRRQVLEPFGDAG